MKKLCLLLALFVLFSFTAKEFDTPKLNNTQQEDVFQISNNKEFLLNYFQQTSDTLQRSIEGLSEAQMLFKPLEGQWSVSQCLEHIMLTEKMLFEMAKELLAQPANPERKEEVKITDRELIHGMTDRSFKATAPKELQPEGKYATPEAALQDLKSQRAEILVFRIRPTKSVLV